MITAIVVYCHAFGTNKDFSPTILYLGTIMADVSIAEYIFKWLM